MHETAPGHIPPFKYLGHRTYGSRLVTNQRSSNFLRQTSPGKASGPNLPCVRELSHAKCKAEKNVYRH
jgi:hypothetical protein